MKGDKSKPTKIGRYEIVDHLGAGGMGVVYLATDPLLRRTVAIKVLPGQDEELRERFAREARSAASLRHNNVVTIYDVGEDDGKPFLAMEFIDGESMAELIRRRAYLTVERRLRFMIELCAGLGYAHRNGIIHRDIKPGNLMITAEGTLKILDFGLARITTDGTSTGLTRAGSILGTPHYMSPEQVEGKPVDPRSDIFSVGLVLYELLAYQKAYSGETAHVVLHNIIHTSPAPIRDLVPDIEPELVRIVDKAIEKSPERRFQDLGAFAADLERVRTRLEKSADTSTRIESRPVSGRKPQLTTAETAPARDVRTRANLDVIAQRRTTQVDSHLKAALEHMAAGRYEEAVAECENAMLLNPQDTRVLELVAQAHTALDDRQVRELMDQARARLASGELTEAQALVDQTLMLRADLAEAQQLRKDVKEQRSERERNAERARAAKSALDRAMRNLEDGAFEAASRSASEVLAYDPGNEGALDVRRRAAAAIEERRRQQEHDQRASEAVEQARLRASGGNPRSALILLEAFTPPHPLVTDALGRVRAEIALLEQKEREEAERRRQRAVEDQRRRERVAALKAEAVDALQARRFADAIRAVDLASQELPADLELQELAGLIRAAEEEAAAADRKRQAVQQHLQDSREALARGDLASASKAIKSVSMLSPSEPEALELREKIRLTQQQREATAAITEAKGFAKAGDFTAALDLLAAFSPQSLVSSAIADLKADQARVELQRAAEARRQAEEAARRQAEEEDKKRAAALALQRQEQARLAAQQQEQARLEKQQQEQARLEKQQQEQARLEQQRKEQTRLELQRQEQMRLEQDRLERARAEKTLRMERVAQEPFPVPRAISKPAPPPTVLNPAAALPETMDPPLARAPEAGAPARPQVAARISPTTVAVLGVIALLLAGGAWFLTRDRAQSPPAAVSAPATVIPEVTTPPAGAPAAGKVPTSSSPVAGSGATAPPPATAPAADADASINLLHAAFDEAMGRNNLDEATKVILGASATARKHPTLAADADRVVAAAKRRATASLSQAQKTPAAQASAEFRSAQAKRTEASDLERRGQLPEAARDYIAAAAGFSRALSAKPPPPVATAPGDRSGQPGGPPTPAGAVGTPSAPPTSVATNPAASEPVTPPAPAPPPAAVSAPVDTTAADTAAIREALAQYVAGYERLDTAAIRRVYPGAPANLNLTDVRSYSLVLDNPQIAINGDRATVKTTRRLRVQMKAGAPQQQTLPTEFTLRRAGNGWVVDQIR